MSSTILVTMAGPSEEKRSRGKRRWGMDAEFPLKDSDGLIVLTDRRRMRDRRLSNTSLEDRLVMFSGQAHWDSE